MSAVGVVEVEMGGGLWSSNSSRNDDQDGRVCVDVMLDGRWQMADGGPGTHAVRVLKQLRKGRKDSICITRGVLQLSRKSESKSRRMSICNSQS